MINLIIHLLFLLLFPPFLLGIINKTKAFFGGRRGIPLFQAYYDLFKLLRKSMVISSTTTWIFFAGPAVVLTVVLLAGLLIPLGYFDAPISFNGDLIFFAYLFALARFFTIAAALDTGSAFEGMGSAREATFTCLTEPALFFAFLVLVKAGGSLKLNDILHISLKEFTLTAITPFVLISIGLFIILLAENCRIPIDDPNTHLELTMIHEVMVLDHSGPLLAVILYSASLKLFILGSVLLHLLMPFKTGWFFLDWSLFAVEMSALALFIGIIESIMARLQMKRVAFLLTGSLLLCAFGFILILR